MAVIKPDAKLRSQDGFEGRSIRWVGITLMYLPVMDGIIGSC
jgi:hypothetical protein